VNDLVLQTGLFGGPDDAVGGQALRRVGGQQGRIAGGDGREEGFSEGLVAAAVTVRS
jgi:hypothetical protein